MAAEIVEGAAPRPPRVAGYRGVELLGRGGMGAAWLAVPTGHRVVAGGSPPPLVVLKVPSGFHAGAGATVAERLAAEAAALVRLAGTPGVPTLLRDGSNRQSPYLVMSRMPGRTLRQAIEDTGPMLLEQVVQFGIELSAILATAAGHGVIHRDVTPSNVLVGNQVSLIDFGIALRVGEERVTGTGFRLGSRPWCAPEQLLGEPVDESADVWAVGHCLAYAATGLMPGREAQAATRVLPEHLHRLIASATDLEAEARPSAAEMVKALKSLQNTLSTAKTSVMSGTTSSEGAEALLDLAVGAKSVSNSPRFPLGEKISSIRRESAWLTREICKHGGAAVRRVALWATLALPSWPSAQDSSGLWTLGLGVGEAYWKPIATLALLWLVVLLLMGIMSGGVLIGLFPGLFTRKRRGRALTRWAFGAAAWLAVSAVCLRVLLGVWDVAVVVMVWFVVTVGFLPLVEVALREGHRRR